MVLRKHNKTNTEILRISIQLQQHSPSWY